MAQGSQEQRQRERPAGQRDARAEYGVVPGRASSVPYGAEPAGRRRALDEHHGAAAVRGATLLGPAPIETLRLKTFDLYQK